MQSASFLEALRSKGSFRKLLTSYACALDPQFQCGMIGHNGASGIIDYVLVTGQF
jgi:hypothetical protein